MRRSAALLVVLALAAVGGTIPAGADHDGCTDETADVHELPDEGGIPGKIAFPSEHPSTLVVFMHGYSHKSDSWVTHMQRVADAGAVVVTPDYRGTYTDEGGNVRGWFVKEGAQDAIDLAHMILDACASIDSVILYGISMGGNSSGLAAAAQATRGDGSPLFDHWFAIEPAANVIETYAGASLLEGVNAFAARAKADIEQEFGGTLAEQPLAYLDGAVMSHLDGIAASGLRGVTVVHGFDDGLVPYNQGRDLALGLRALGLPTDFYNVARRGADDKGDNTGLTEYALGPTGQYDEPMAGHGSERSDTHIVTQTGLTLLLDMLAGGLDLAAANREFLVDAEAGIVPIL